MELLIIFLIVRVVGNAWDAKVAEFRASQSHVRAEINRKYPNAPKDRREQMVRNAARRNTIGYAAYQLRHGFPALWGAFHTGWLDAREGHDEWIKRREKSGETGRPGWREQVKEAWNGRNKPEAERVEPEVAKPQQPEPEPPTPSGGKPPEQPQAAADTTPKTDNRPPDTADTEAPHLRPVPDIRPTGGTATVEAPNYDAAKAAISNAGAAAGTTASNLEQTVADMLAGGMGADQATMGHIANMQEALATAQAHATAAVASMGKHSSGKEYADTGHAARTEWLKTS